MQEFDVMGKPANIGMTSTPIEGAYTFMPTSLSGATKIALKSAGLFSDEERALFASIRLNLPELAHWGDMAIGTLWGEYCSAVYQVKWKLTIEPSTDYDLFINFIYYQSVNGNCFEISTEELIKFDGWRKG